MQATQKPTKLGLGKRVCHCIKPFLLTRIKGVNTVNFQYMNEYSKSFPRAKFLDLDALSDSGAISDESGIYWLLAP